MPAKLKITEAAPLSAVAAGQRQPGRLYRARLIEGDRWGSSGYYSMEALRQAAKDNIFHVGLPIFADHPGQTEQHDRPERSIRDMAGALASDAVAESDGLYADILVYPQWEQPVDAMKDNIGMSIRAYAEISQGEAAGREGTLIDRFTEADSVDFVTRAGAGGKITQLIESARSAWDEKPAQPPFRRLSEAPVGDRLDQLQRVAPTGSWVRDYNPEESLVYFARYDEAQDRSITVAQQFTVAEDDQSVALAGQPYEVRVVTQYVPVSSAGQETPTTESTEKGLVKMAEIDDARLRELEEKAARVAALEAERDTERQKREAAEASEAATKIATAAEKRAREAAADLPPQMSDRVIEKVTADGQIPCTEAGALDEAKFDQSVKDAIAKEQEYAKSFSTNGLTGFGASTAGAQESHTGPRKSPWGRQIKEG